MLLYNSSNSNKLSEVQSLFLSLYFTPLLYKVKVLPSFYNFYLRIYPFIRGQITSNSPEAKPVKVVHAGCKRSQGLPLKAC